MCPGSYFIFSLLSVSLLPAQYQAAELQLSQECSAPSSTLSLVLTALKLSAEFKIAQFTVFQFETQQPAIQQFHSEVI